jgi:hypothetical protein
MALRQLEEAAFFFAFFSETQKKPHNAAFND